MDEWNPEAFGEPAEEEEDFAASYEQVVFLIDASPPMLDPCQIDEKGVAEDERDFVGLTWLEAAVKVAHSVMKQKVISGGGDQVAVLLYGTEHASPAVDGGQAAFDNTWSLQELEQPGADAIGRLEAFSLPAFRSKMGCAPPGVQAGALQRAFWAAKVMGGASKGAKNQQKPTRRLLLFTRTATPMAVYSKGRDYTPEWRSLKGRINALRGARAALELYPMTAPGEEFDLAPFWRTVLLELRGGGEEGEELEEGQQLYRIQSLVSFVRSKAHKRRATASLTWTLGGGLTCAVKMFQTVQAQKVPAPLIVHSRTNKEVKWVSGPYVDKYTGTTYDEDGDGEATAGGGKKAADALPPAAGLKLCFPKTGRHGSRLPKVYLTREEMAAIKGRGQGGGMTLLGFKPVSALKDQHQMRSPSFFYPDERSQPGSAAAFVALHQAMQDADCMAVCRLAATRAREPRLVALLPQTEAIDEDGIQVVPPGMQAVYLPWTDDLRAPERDANFTGPGVEPPDEEQVAAAEALIAQLSLDEGTFHLESIPNPALQRFYEVLEAKALGEEPPALGDSQPDYTLPSWDPAAGDEEDEEDVAARAAVCDAFKEALGLHADVAPKAAKRKAAEPVDTAAVEALGVEALAETGGLGSLTVPDLKSWLKAHGQKVAGNKGDLIARIQLKLGITG